MVKAENRACPLRGRRLCCPMMSASAAPTTSTRSSPLPLISGACQHRWIEPSYPRTALDAGPHVCSSLPLGSHSRSEGLGFNQWRFHHTRLATFHPEDRELPLTWPSLHALVAFLASSVRVSRACRELSSSSHNCCCTPGLPLQRHTRKNVGTSPSV